jgi:hypothetical protein
MGVLDEAAIDRLYLISELSKHVCVRADAAAAMQGDEEARGGGGKLGGKNQVSLVLPVFAVHEDHHVPPLQCFDRRIKFVHTPSFFPGI